MSGNPCSAPCSGQRICSSTSPPRRISHALRGRPYAWIALFVVLLAIMVRQDDASNSPNHEKTSLIHHNGHSSPVPFIERGKEIGAVVTAQELYKAYKEIQADYHTKAFGSESKWSVLREGDGIEIAMLQHPDDPHCPYVRMTAVMPASVRDCWDFLRLDSWDRTMPKMDPFYEGVEIKGDYRHKGVTMTLARKRTKRILTFGKRDFVFISVADIPHRDGTLTSGTVSVITKRLPRTRGYTRAFQDSVAFYRPLGKNKTHLTIVCRIDLNDSLGEGGAIPMWLYGKTIGVTGARSVLAMRQYLEQETREEAPRNMGQKELKNKGVLGMFSKVKPFRRGKAPLTVRTM